MTRAKPWQFGVCFVACALLFQHAAIALVAGLMAWLLFEVAFKRNKKVLALLISSTLSFTILEFAGRVILKKSVGRTFNTDVDHRMKPNPAQGINSDGIRSRVESDDFHDDTFNILFMGDSFVFGIFLDDKDTIPAQIERLCAQRQPASRVRAVNLAWSSSSPGPGYRLLADIGAKYKPDLVVDCLDLSDFRDDFRALTHTGYWDFSPTVYFLRLVGLGGTLVELHDAWRPRAWLGGEGPLERPLPAYWQFVVNQPLGASLPYMKETERNLGRINTLCRDVLHVPFAVVLFPRQFQYSDTECPQDPAHDSYVIRGPYVREPEHWFTSLKARVDYPCESLLTWFEESPVFPKCFPNDPHWNAEGCGVAAEGIIRFLEARGLLKTSAPTSMPASP